MKTIPAPDFKVIREALFDLPVNAAYLFGSHARGTAGPLSDIDIAIDTQQATSYKIQILHAYEDSAYLRQLIQKVYI